MKPGESTEGQGQSRPQQACSSESRTLPRNGVRVPTKKSSLGTGGARRGGVTSCPHAWRVLPSSSQGGLCGIQRAIHQLGKQDQAPLLGRPALLPGQQPQEVTGRPPPCPRSRTAASRGCLGSFSTPSPRAANARGFTSGHAPPHASSVNFRGGPPRSPCLSSPPQDSRHLSPEFLQKWAYHL